MNDYDRRPLTRLTDRVIMGIYRFMTPTATTRPTCGAILSDPTYPAPGSAEELIAFAEIQRGLASMFGRVFSDRIVARTVVV